MRFITYTNSMDTLSVPEWIKTERYMYCDNFVNDYMKSDRFSLLSFIRNLFRRQEGAATRSDLIFRTVALTSVNIYTLFSKRSIS